MSTCIFSEWRSWGMFTLEISHRYLRCFSGFEYFWPLSVGKQCTNLTLLPSRKVTTTKKRSQLRPVPNCVEFKWIEVDKYHGNACRGMWFQMPSLSSQLKNTSKMADQRDPKRSAMLEFISIRHGSGTSFETKPCFCRTVPYSTTEPSSQSSYICRTELKNGRVRSLKRADSALKLFYGLTRRNAVNEA